jgi:phage tail-like protein
MEISWDLGKYIGAFNFRISIDGIRLETSKIVSISGVGAESKLVDDSTNDKKPLSGGGVNLFSEVEIKRVYQGYDQLYNWRLMIEEGLDSLRTVAIEILASDLNTVVRKIILHNAWPHKWQLPNLDASSTAPAIETISLAYERITGSMGGRSPGEAYSGEGTSYNTTTFFTNDTTQDQGDEEQDAGDSFGNQEPTLEELEARYAAALALALAQNLGPIDPNEEIWAPPETGDGITDNLKRGGEAGSADGMGSKANTTALGESQVFADTGSGTGPIDPNEETWDAPEAGDETQDFRDSDDTKYQGTATEWADTSGEGTPIDPNEETWDAPEAGDGITDNLKRGGEAGSADGTGSKGNTTAMGESQVFADTGGGTGPKANTTATGESQAFADTGSGTGPIDPNEETWDAPEAGGETQDFRDSDDTKYQGTATEWADTSGDGTPIDPNEETWDAPEGIEDPTAARQGGDGSGPISGREGQAEADYGEGSGPIGGREGQAEADYGEGSGPIDNEAVDYGGSAAADDPTAAENGGDGSGPVGGREEQAEAEYGEGSGPIDNEAVDYGGSAAADDPTAARQGGDGSGPVGGRGEQAEADYGEGGDGPKGGRGEGGGGETE